MYYKVVSLFWVASIVDFLFGFFFFFFLRRLCEFSRNSEDFVRLGREEYMRKVEEEREKEKEREKERERERERQRKEKQGELLQDTPSKRAGSGKGKHGDDREGMKLMSNRMGERVGAAKTVKKKMQNQVRDR